MQQKCCGISSAYHILQKYCGEQAEQLYIVHRAQKRWFAAHIDFAEKDVIIAVNSKRNQPIINDKMTKASDKRIAYLASFLQKRQAFDMSDT